LCSQPDRVFGRHNASDFEVDRDFREGQLDRIEELRQKTKRGPLHSAEFKILEIWAKHFPAAQELLNRREQIGVKARKLFTEIVQAAPRLEGEMFHAWVQRILDASAKYETRIPTILSEELLTRLSRRGLKKRME